MSDLGEILAAEPSCCGTPMVHNSATGNYECADAFFALIDSGVISDEAPWGYVDEMTDEQRALYEHWRKSFQPDGWDA